MKLNKKLKFKNYGFSKLSYPFLIWIASLLSNNFVQSLPTHSKRVTTLNNPKILQAGRCLKPSSGAVEIKSVTLITPTTV